MTTLQTLLLVFQTVVAIVLIGFILIQHGKGADAGAAFGSGASGTVFGSQGSSNFFTKTTAILAILFFGNSLFLAYLATHPASQPASLLESESSIMIDPAAPASSGGNDTQATGAASEATPEEIPLQPPAEADQQPGSDEVPLVPQQ